MAQRFVQSVNAKLDSGCKIRDAFVDNRISANAPDSRVRDP
jgi:hypothetical protein